MGLEASRAFYVAKANEGFDVCQIKLMAVQAIPETEPKFRTCYHIVRGTGEMFKVT
jgi:hypothetical protein